MRNNNNITIRVALDTKIQKLATKEKVEETPNGDLTTKMLATKNPSIISPNTIVKNQFKTFSKYKNSKSQTNNEAQGFVKKNRKNSVVKDSKNITIITNKGENNNDSN